MASVTPISIWFPLGFLALTAHAYTKFDTKCSAPTEVTNFVSSPDTRGTLDILWSCLFTIFACTWTIQHLNVPEQRDGRDPGFWGDVKWRLGDMWRNFKWMLGTMVAPELILGKALCDLQGARHWNKSLERLAEVDEVEWSLTHTYYANMGGFVLRGATPGRAFIDKDETPSEPVVVCVTDQEHTTVTEQETKPTAPVPNNGSLEISQAPKTMTQKGSVKHIIYQSPCHLKASDIIALREAGLLERLPSLSKDEINDKSKGDAFVKAIAVGQIMWVTIQIIGRGSEHIAISQLEIVVAAYSVCAIIIYALSWMKPKDVKAATTIMQYPSDIPLEILEFLHERKDKQVISLFDDMYNLETSRRLAAKIPVGMHIPNDYPGNYEAFTALGIVLGAALFGGIHIVAWNFFFPTTIEHELWRIASITSTVLLPFFFVVIILLVAIFKMDTDKFPPLAFWLIYFIYLVTRLFLFVETFRVLCFMPPSAFYATWSSDIIHVG